MERDSNRKRVEQAARLIIALPFEMTFIKMINDATYRTGNTLWLAWSSPIGSFGYYASGNHVSVVNSI